MCQEEPLDNKLVVSTAVADVCRILYVILRDENVAESRFANVSVASQAYTGLALPTRSFRDDFSR